MALKPKNGAAPDEFCDDGKTKKLNKSRPYGTVYSAMLDEWKGRAMPPEEAAFVQDLICYRGDGIPVGYVPAAERGEPVVVPVVEEVLAENEALTRQVNTQAEQIADLMRRLKALEGPPATKKGEPHAAGARA